MNARGWMRQGLAVLAFGASLAATASLAQEDEHDEHVFAAGAITIDHPWARAAAAGSDTLAFFETENEGGPDILLSASTTIAASVEIVGLALTGDTIDMVPVGPIEIPTGTFELDPGGLALALRGLTADLAEGTEFELTLVFAEAGEVTVHVAVETADAMTHGHAH